MKNSDSKNAETVAFSASDFTFSQKISLFNKPMAVQYSILVLWILSGMMGLYYLIYIASYDDFVRMGILPYNLEWMLILLSVFIVIGVGLLLYPVDPVKYEKLRLEQQYDQEVVQIEIILENDHFLHAISEIERVLGLLNSYHISKDQSALLKLLHTATINQVLANQIKDLRQSFEDLSSSQKIMRYKNIKTGVHENNTILHESVHSQFRDLAVMFTREAPEPSL